MNDLILGSCALFFPGQRDALTLPVVTEEKRSVGEPENEPALKGVRESFVESVRTNTSMVRRHLKAPELKIREHIVGRRSRTQVDVLYLDGIADPNTVERVRRRLDGMDIDGVEAAGNIEEYLTDHPEHPLSHHALHPAARPLLPALLEGRVGLMADGLPFAWMLPGTIDQFFKTGQDRAFHWMAASALNVIRWFCAFVTILVPGLYIALVTFHPEAIPVKLALSIVAAKQEVPFSTVFEVLIMLLAFEVLQEAGLRLPSPIGATVSILGGWWWATRRWRPTSSPRRCSSPWPSPGWPGTLCPPRTSPPPCGCGGFYWPSWPARRGCSAWRRGAPPSSTTWPGWRPSGVPYLAPSPAARGSPGAIPACSGRLCPG